MGTDQTGYLIAKILDTCFGCEYFYINIGEEYDINFFCHNIVRWEEEYKMWRKIGVEIKDYETATALWFDNHYEVYVLDDFLPLDKECKYREEK